MNPTIQWLTLSIVALAWDEDHPRISTRLLALLGLVGSLLTAFGVPFGVPFGVHV